jgi:hypothetical protein
MTIYLKVPEGVLIAELLEDSWTNESRKCQRLTACHTTDKLLVKHTKIINHTSGAIVAAQENEILMVELSDDDKKNLMENTTLPKGHKYFLNEDLARCSNEYCGAWVNYFNGGTTTETFTPDGERLYIIRSYGSTQQVEEYYSRHLSAKNNFKNNKYFGKQYTYYSESEQVHTIGEYSESGEVVDKEVYYKNGNYKSRENNRFRAYFNEKGEPIKIVKKKTVYYFEDGKLKNINVYGNKKKDFIKRMKLKVARQKMELKILCYIC